MSAIELLISPRPHDLSEFSVRRALPYRKRRTVGPFIFFDHMGPAVLSSGAGMGVRPHPHIGLATCTYLFDGVIRHRDSLGYVQDIRPGDINWMVAGRGIVHSERSPEDTIGQDVPIHGIQMWVALPQTHEEMAPSFTHHPADTIPTFEHQGARLDLLIGQAYGCESPVEFYAPIAYLAAVMPAGGTLDFDVDYEERGVYVVSGELELSGEPVREGQLAVVSPGEHAVLTARTPVVAMLIAGAPVDAERTIFWNFVSSRPERIEQAKADWKQGRFDMVPGDDEFIPLPEG